MRQGVRKHFFNEDYFESIDNEEKAYWLGFISADGCVFKSSKNNSYRLCINISSKDEEHLELFKKCICANDIKIQKYTNKSGFSSKDGTEMSRIVLNSYKMCSDLSKYNVHERKSYDFTFPNIDDKFKPHFLRGFFDGDGCYYINYDGNRYRVSFELVGASYQFIDDVKEYLSNNDIVTYIYTRKNKNVYRLMSGSIKMVSKIIELLYSDYTICLDRKLSKVNEIMNIAV